MRVLLWITGLLAVLYSGYWFVGKNALQSGAEAFFATAMRDGRVAGHAGLTVEGFPSRFDLTVTEPHLADPARGLDWRAPFVQLLTLSYTPWHVIMAFAPTQTLRTPAEEITLTNESLKASLIVTPGAALALDRTTFIGTDVVAASTLGWRLAAEGVRFATRIDPSLANTHGIGIEVTKLSPDPALAARVPAMPRVIDLIRLDALATFSAPLDRFAAETQPALTALSVKNGVFTWGTLQASASGDLTVAAGVPEGRIELSVRGWRDLVPMAVSIGAIKPEVAPTVIRVMEALATASGDPEVLEMPLVFAGGRMSLGPLPLGPAPRLN